MISLEGMDLLTGDPDPQPVHVYASHPLAKPPLDLPQSAPSVPSQSSAEEEVLSSTASSHSPDNTVQIVWNSSTTLPCKKTPEPPRSPPLPPIKIVDLTISPDSTVKKPSPLELARMEQKARKEGRELPPEFFNHNSPHPTNHKRNAYRSEDFYISRRKNELEMLGLRSHETVEDVGDMPRIKPLPRKHISPP